MKSENRTTKRNWVDSRKECLSDEDELPVGKQYLKRNLPFAGFERVVPKINICDFEFRVDSEFSIIVSFVFFRIDVRFLGWKEIGFHWSEKNLVFSLHFLFDLRWSCENLFAINKMSLNCEPKVLIEFFWQFLKSVKNH